MYDVISILLVCGFSIVTTLVFVAVIAMLFGKDE